jgi:hypothetical protein
LCFIGKAQAAAAENETEDSAGAPLEPALVARRSA